MTSLVHRDDPREVFGEARLVVNKSALADQWLYMKVALSDLDLHSAKKRDEQLFCWDRERNHQGKPSESLSLLAQEGDSRQT
jgi:hypothetical protein